MKKIFFVGAMLLALSGCDDLEFNAQERAVARANCDQVGGKIYFSNYQPSGNPMWANCFVEGFKYSIGKEGEMYK